MPLFFFGATDANGENLDFFVRAETLEKAADLYRATIDGSFNEPDGDVRCWHVPDAEGPEEVIGWEDLNVAMITP